ncbi:hypothetical protein GIY62_00010 [Burkholderia plantarii]|uniref:hypothetical protein n=1 Tax=Burkholderia plantarii TaxID=41899 RepID=UPI002729DF5D|nr:hypothetical protein [Burkholderia plantarii]WLE59142.1 hypothetical protein GIY62_00010 [Burkholderia plantarii]
MRFPLIFFLLIGVSLAAGAAPESTEGTGGVLFKRYDEIEKDQQRKQADLIRESIKTRMNQDRMDLHGKFPYQVHRYVAPDRSISIQPRSKNTSTYCFTGPDHSSTCGASLTW